MSFVRCRRRRFRFPLLFPAQAREAVRSALPSGVSSSSLAQTSDRAQDPTQGCDPEAAARRDRVRSVHEVAKPLALRPAGACSPKGMRRTHARRQCAAQHAEAEASQRRAVTIRERRGAASKLQARTWGQGVQPAARTPDRPLGRSGVRRGEPLVAGGPSRQRVPQHPADTRGATPRAPSRRRAGNLVGVER